MFKNKAPKKNDYKYQCISVVLIAGMIVVLIMGIIF